MRDLTVCPFTCSLEIDSKFRKSSVHGSHSVSYTKQQKISTFFLLVAVRETN